MALFAITPEPQVPEPQVSEPQVPEPQETRKVITANRLRDGASVYMVRPCDGEQSGVAASDWSEDIALAWVGTTQDEQQAMLARAEAATQSCLVVGPYLIDVAGEGADRVAHSLRERIRARGPTIRRDDNARPRPNPARLYP